jgi:hypothetical protein
LHWARLGEKPKREDEEKEDEEKKEQPGQINEELISADRMSE